MGYIEETGAAQHFRDSRIAPIYEGTNGIQANDLVGRKLARDSGEAMADLIAEMRETLAQLGKAGKETADLQRPLEMGVAALDEATRALVATGGESPARAAAAAVPYLRMAGTVIGGWLLARGALAAAARLAAGDSDDAFLRGKIGTARFYSEHVLPGATALLAAASGGESVLGFDPELL
jgi:hypothetical protein